MPYSLSPLSPASQKLLQSPRKAARKIAKVPFKVYLFFDSLLLLSNFNCSSLVKVLDAPELQDDFYLNLVDWSSQNVLSVGLGACVYLWAAATSQVCLWYFMVFPSPQLLITLPLLCSGDAIVRFGSGRWQCDIRGVGWTRTFSFRWNP